MAQWDDLRVFLAVARAESLTAAAPGLRMDPATLSRRIARLEADLGAPLFAKSPQGYALTDRGLRLRDHVAAAEADLREGLEEGRAAEGLTGQIRIGAPDRRQFPAAAGLRRDLPRQSGAGGAGAGAAASRQPVQARSRHGNHGQPAGCRAADGAEIAEYRLHLAMRRDASPVQSLAEVEGRALVGYIPDMVFDRELDYLDRLGADGVQLASNSVSVQLQMLRQGGVGIVHDFALPFAPELGRVLTREVSLTRAFHLVRHADDRRSDRINRFAAALIAGLKAEIARLEALAAGQDAAPAACEDS